LGTPVIENVQTQAFGFASIQRHYFDKCGIQHIFDEHVELNARRKVLTWGDENILFSGFILDLNSIPKFWCQVSGQPLTPDTWFSPCQKE